MKKEEESKQPDEIDLDEALEKVLKPEIVDVLRDKNSVSLIEVDSLSLFGIKIRGIKISGRNSIVFLLGVATGLVISSIQYFF